MTTNSTIIVLDIEGFKAALAKAYPANNQDWRDAGCVRLEGGDEVYDPSARGIAAYEELGNTYGMQWDGFDEEGYPMWLYN